VIGKEFPLTSIFKKVHISFSVQFSQLFFSLPTATTAGVQIGPLAEREAKFIAKSEL